MASPEEHDTKMANDADPFGDEPMLPQLPAWSQDATGQDAYGRKRAYPFKTPGTDGLPSSDIGFFSSDDDPALDNYARARQKRRYRGTWYDHNRMQSEADAPQNDDDPQEDVVPETPRAKARGSGTGETASKGTSKAHSGAGHPPPTPPPSNPVHSHTFTPNRRFPPNQVFSPGQRFPSSQAVPSSQTYSTEPARKQLAVKQAIESCIDRGESVIDLTNSDLDDECISADTFRPLIELRLVPHVQARVPTGHSRDPLTTSKDGYLHRESEIVLIMANNRLTRLPGTLFGIENLVELSLRHNQLTELPPAIAQCKSLRSLNLSFNRLRHLPFELVEQLPQFVSLSLAGNDFFQPDTLPASWEAKVSEEVTFPSHISHELDMNKSDISRHAAWYVGRGAVQYSDTAGKIYSKFRIPSAGGEENPIVLEDASERAGPLSRHQGESESRPSTNMGSTSVPSLVELCARSLAKSGQPEDYGDLTWEPEILGKAVTAATRARYNGGQSCAVCKKHFVIPRTQWIEFFYYNKTQFAARLPSGSYYITAPSVVHISASARLHNLIPCLRSGCSWNCVPYQRELQSGQMVLLNS